MNCEQARTPERVEKYVAGQLSEPELSDFEEHYFGCEECLEAVQVGQAIHYGAAAEPSNVVQMPHQPRVAPRRWQYALAAAAAVLVVTVVGWRGLADRNVIHPTPEVASKGREPVASPSPAAAGKSIAEPQLLASNLGAVEPLTYRPSVLRGANEDFSQRFQQAMEWYLKRDYKQTVASLSRIPVGVPGSGATDEHVTDAGVQLYLGISQLMLNQNAEAIRSLRRAEAYGDTPYLENAGYYLAKGLIRQKQYAEASAELQRVILLNGDRQADATRLVEQISQTQSR